MRMALKFLLRHKKALSLLISVAMLATIVSIVGVKEIANAIATIEKRYLALALGIFILSLLVSALRWQLLINALGTRTRYGKILEYTLVDKFANSFVPTSAMGIAIRSVLLEREYHIPKSRGLATIMLDYGVDIFGSFMLAVPCYLYLTPDLSSRLDRTFKTSLVTIGIVMVLIFLISSLDIVIEKRKEHGKARSRFGERLLHGGKYTRKFIEFSRTFSVLLTNPRLLAKTVVLTIAKGILDALRVYVLFSAFGMSVPLYYFILFDSAWVFLAPLMFTPGGVGVIETGRIALYSLIPDITPRFVTPIVFIDRLITYWLMVVVGAVVFFLTGVDATLASGFKAGEAKGQAAEGSRE